MKKVWIIAALLIFSAPAHAEDYVVANVGVYGIFNAKNETLYGAEYRSDTFYDEFRAIAGGWVSSESAMYGYGGVQYDYEMLENIFLSPSFAVGLYRNAAGEKGLGGPLEFRTGIEAAYAVGNMGRVGLSLAHISNAYIYESNPGTETVTLSFIIPLR